MYMTDVIYMYDVQYMQCIYCKDPEQQAHELKLFDALFE